MAGRDEVEELLLSRRSGELVTPSYRDFCLSSVPPTILSLFGIKGDRPTIPRQALGADEAEKVVLFVADGLGYYDARRNFRDGLLLGTAASKDLLIPITSVFPSTTTAALTTLCTGLTPQEHCLPEWFVYMKEVGRVVIPLQFSAVGQRGRDALVGEMNPRTLFRGRSINWSLRRRGVQAVSFIGAPLARTVYSKLSHAGSEIVPFITSSDLMASLRRRIETTRGRAFFYVYWEKVDTIGHAYGPGTEESRSEVSLLSHLLKTELVDRLSPRARSETVLMLTADHGQIPVDPSRVRYLNGERRVTRALARDPQGRAIPPWGSARDMYMALKEERLEATVAFLGRLLGREAAVLRTSDAVAAGLFGINRPQTRFLDRIGDAMVLPRRRNLVWYKYQRGKGLDLRGHHGGMDPKEMLIPLVAARASSLR